MNDDRRDSTNPGRRYTDAATRELVRTMLKKDGYVTEEHADLRYVRQDQIRGALDNRRANIAIGLAIASPWLAAVANYLIG